MMSYKNNFIKYFLLIVLLAVFVACSKIPRKYIQPDEMKKIMWEMMFADKLTTHASGSRLVLTDSMSRAYSEVLKFHRVSKEKFVRSLRYYESDPEMQKALYDSIYNYGSRMNERLQERIRKQDSIKAVRITDSLKKANPDSLRRDSIRRDSIVRKDSLVRLDSIRKDSLSKKQSLKTARRDDSIKMRVSAQ